MRLQSVKAKIILALIILCTFIVPATEITPEAQEAYELAAYEQLLRSMPSPAPATPTPTAAPTIAPAVIMEGASPAAATMLPTFAPTSAPQYMLPMNNYSGGFEPDASGYYTEQIFLEDGTSTTAQCYKDPTIEVKYYTQRYFDSDCHFAYVKVAHPSQLRTAISQEVQGTSTCETSEMAKAKNAIVAMSGEYYTKRESAVFVVKQSKMLKSSPAAQLHQLIIDTDGNFHITTDKESSRQMIAQLSGKVYQAFSFGPALVVDGQMQDYPDYYFDASGENPRAAIGQTGYLEYLLCVADGRTSEDAGITTTELAQIMAEKKCINALNLDGGGTSTFYWHGNVVNDMNESGNERSISDCVYFASAYPD